MNPAKGLSSKFGKVFQRRRDDSSNEEVLPNEFENDTEVETCPVEETQEIETNETVSASEGNVDNKPTFSTEIRFVSSQLDSITVNETVFENEEEAIAQLTKLSAFPLKLRRSDPDRKQLVLGCERSGMPSMKSAKSKRCNCPFTIRLQRVEDSEKYCVTELCNEHNHYPENQILAYIKSIDLSSFKLPESIQISNLVKLLICVMCVLAFSLRSGGLESPSSSSVAQKVQNMTEQFTVSFKDVERGYKSQLKEIKNELKKATGEVETQQLRVKKAELDLAYETERLSVLQNSS